MNKKEISIDKPAPEDRQEVLTLNEKGLVGSLLANAKEIGELTNTLRQIGRIKLPNGAEMDCLDCAKIIEKVTRDIYSGRFSFAEGCLYITSKMDLRKHYQALMQEELAKQAEHKKLIKKAKSFKELYGALEEIGEIHSRNPEIKTTKWIVKIMEVREHIRVLNGDTYDLSDASIIITGALGLRDKVVELLREEIKAKKRGS